ncbi:DUF4390 domain-containing protein [Wenzhouxiangella marina]|uniref:DUF4390 domain-containing protein n=1 Tax=Wenzhouxiangella marina TaxID=1579979 RepID=UPI000673320C|nr:DUF4390 domain-containing protein [Wenzhouxiangella marina]MBB6088475.1 hypothetical protein [Wenzhouxiangella marina]
MVFSIWLCVACQSDAPSNASIDLIEPAPVWRDGQLYFRTAIDWRLGPDVVEALHHGVVVPLELSVRISQHHGLVALEDRTHNHRFEVRYLPLLRDYEVFDVRADTRTRYPRLGMLTSAMARQRFYSTGLSEAEVEQRRWQVQLRAYLDRTRLPSPMRLPAWFDRRWRVEGPWHSWVFPPEPQA